MYRLLIADDEEPVRNGLKASIDWEKYDIQLIGEASDGDEALAIIKEQQPDIIITDIMMSGPDGLELTQKAIEVVPHAKIVIFSGYEDFSFVQTAIRNGAFDYVLKPVKVEYMLQIIEKAIKAIKKEVSRVKKEDEIRKRFDENLPVLKERYLYYLLENRMTMGDIVKEHDYLNLNLGNEDFVVLVMEIEEFENINRNQGEKEKQVLMFSVKDLVRQIICDEHRGEVLDCYPNRLIILMNYQREQDKDEILEKLYFLCKKIKVFVQKHYNLLLTVGIGGLYAQPQYIANAHREAVDALEYRLFLGKGQIIYYGDISVRSQNSVLLYPVEVEEKILLALKLGDVDNACENTEHFIKAFSGNRNISPEQLRSMCLQLVYSIFRKLMEWNFKIDMAQGNFARINEMVAKQVSLEDLSRFLVTYIGDIAGRIYEQKKLANQTVIQKAIEYMEKNFAQDLTIQDIARSIYLTPNYFSNIYRNVVGETILDTLTAVRIKKAKELLLTTELKNYEIAERVGYRDTKYFVQLFKKNTGLTPAEFRTQRKGGDGR